MNTSKLNSGTIAILIVALLVAGGIFLVVGLILAVNQLRGKS